MMRCPKSFFFFAAFSLSAVVCGENSPTAEKTPPAPSLTQVGPTVSTATTPPPTETAAPNVFYYYCEGVKAYYPTVQSCPAGWIAIPVGSPPPVMDPHWTAHTSAESEELVRSRPNVVSLEFFGRALLYSVNYDRALSDFITVGAGVSVWPASLGWWRSNPTITVFPVYANFFFTPDSSRGFLSAGADVVFVSQSGWNDTPFTNNGVAAVFGGGYEFRDDSGFLVRVGAYLVAKEYVSFNPSIVLGAAF